MLSAIFSLVLAVGFVFFLEYLDGRIKTPDEIKSQLGLPFLGMVPVSLPTKESPGTNLLIANGVPPPFLEAFRGLRTNLLFSATTPGQRPVVVTSTAPGEGKTGTSGCGTCSSPRPRAPR